MKCAHYACLECLPTRRQAECRMPLLNSSRRRAQSGAAEQEHRLLRTMNSSARAPSFAPPIMGARRRQQEQRRHARGSPRNGARSAPLPGDGGGGLNGGGQNVGGAWRDYCSPSYHTVGAWYAKKGIVVPNWLGQRPTALFDSPVRPAPNDARGSAVAAGERRSSSSSGSSRSPPPTQGSRPVSSVSSARTASVPSVLLPRAAGASPPPSQGTPGGSPPTGDGRPRSSTFSMSAEDKRAEQKSNIVGVIQAALASSRRLYGQTLSDVRAVFHAFDTDHSGQLDTGAHWPVGAATHSFLC